MQHSQGRGITQLVRMPWRRPGEGPQRPSVRMAHLGPFQEGTHGYHEHLCKRAASLSLKRNAVQVPAGASAGDLQLSNLSD